MAKEVDTYLDTPTEMYFGVRVIRKLRAANGRRFPYVPLKVNYEAAGWTTIEMAEAKII